MRSSFSRSFHQAASANIRRSTGRSGATFSASTSLPKFSASFKSNTSPFTSSTTSSASTPKHNSPPGGTSTNGGGVGSGSKSPVSATTTTTSVSGPSGSSSAVTGASAEGDPLSDDPCNRRIANPKDPPPLSVPRSKSVLAAPILAPPTFYGGVSGVQVLESIHPRTVKGKKRDVDLSVYDQCVNNIMKNGEKSKAVRMVDKALVVLQGLVKESNLSGSPVQLLEEAIHTVSPMIRLISERRGAKNILIPRPLTEKRRRRTAIMWILDSCGGGGGKKKAKKDIRPFEIRFGTEVYRVLKGDSGALGKREQLHKLGLANRSNVVMFDRRKR